MKKTIFLRALFLLGVILTACTTTPSLDEQAQRNEVLSGIGHNLHSNQDRQAVTIPFLHQPSLEKAWGKPHLSVDRDGSYVLQYNQPDNSLEGFQIYGFKKPLPTLTKVPKWAEQVTHADRLTTIYHDQQWKNASLSLRGQPLPIRYYKVDSGSGADSPMDSTDTFTVSEGGRKGYYVLRSSSMTEGSATKRFQGVVLD